MACWLGFQAFTVMAWVQSLVEELRSCKLQKKKEKKKEKKRSQNLNWKEYLK